MWARGEPQPGAACRLSSGLNVSLILTATILGRVPFHPNPILKGGQAAADDQLPGDQMVLGFSQKPLRTGKSQLASNLLEADKGAFWS